MSLGNTSAKTLFLVASSRLEGHGLPTQDIGKVAVCMTADDSDRIYALIETGDGVPWEGGDTDGGELWRSDDGGANWQLTSHNRDLAGRTAYYTRCEVAPDDKNEAYFIAASFSTSRGPAISNVSFASTIARTRIGTCVDH